MVGIYWAMEPLCKFIEKRAKSNEQYATHIGLEWDDQGKTFSGLTKEEYHHSCSPCIWINGWFLSRNGWWCTTFENTIYLVSFHLILSHSFIHSYVLYKIDMHAGFNQMYGRQFSQTWKKVLQRGKFSKIFLKCNMNLLDFVSCDRR